jgi:16S rRNA (guanine527-N7)-methyltransferase
MRAKKVPPPDDESRDDVDPELLDEELADEPELGEIEVEAGIGEEEEGGDEEADPDAEAEADSDEEAVEFANAKIPTEKELRAALGWAFSGESDADAALLDSYARHARLMLEAARRMNLTKIIDAKEVAAKHYLDSWRSTRLLPLMGRTLVDIGSGAGFPGIPVAISEIHTRVILIESKQKKAEFLRQSVTELKLKNVTVVNERAEDHLARNRYDVAIMRAVSSVRENVRLLRKVRHSIKDLVMLKGPSWSREVRAGEREAERLGFRLDTVWEHELPGGLGQRAVLVYAAPGGQGL